MVVYTCVCCKFETNHKNKYERHLSTKKHIDMSIVEDDRYKALEDKYKALEDDRYKAFKDKYKALEDKYKALEDNYKALEISPILDEDNAVNKVEDISEDKVYNVSDMLSKKNINHRVLEK